MTAGNGELSNTGEGTIHYKTEEGRKHSIVFQNADVGMHIISTNGLAKRDNDVTFRAEDGYIKHIPTGETTKFIARGGVYFLKLYVPRDIVKTNSQDIAEGLH